MIRFFLGLFVIQQFFVGCARQASPTGGEKDTLAPRLIHANPSVNAVNVDRNIKELRFVFNEYITLKNNGKDLVLSPPMKKKPEVESVNITKKVRLKLLEPLRENTTYTLNFGNSVQDNNEGNVLKNLTYSFSTGSSLDSLSLQGRVREPWPLKQEDKATTIWVALYKVDSSFTDSAIVKQNPYYLSAAQKDGSFSILNLSSGSYRIYAYNTKENHLRYGPHSDKIAFLEKPISIPTDNQPLLTLLETSAEKLKIQTKTNSNQINFYANKPDLSLRITPLDSTFFEKTRWIYNKNKDSIQLWFKGYWKDKNTHEQRFVVHHKEGNDTLKATLIKKTEKRKLIIKKSRSIFHPGDSVELVSNLPLDSLDLQKIEVKKKDTLISAKWHIDKKNATKVKGSLALAFDQNYNIVLKKGALFDFFKETNDSLSLNIKTPKKNDLGNLKLSITPKPKHPFWITLISPKNIILKELYIENLNVETIDFNNLNPGDYYIRVVIDQNKNRLWDKGNVFKGIPAEPFYLNEKAVNIKANWDIDYRFNLDPEPNQNSETKP